MIQKESECRHAREFTCPGFSQSREAHWKEMTASPFMQRNSKKYPTLVKSILMLLSVIPPLSPVIALILNNSQGKRNRERD